MKEQTKKKPPKIGFRRRINSYYEGMTKKQIAADTAKTAFRWLWVSAFLFVYWMAMLLLASVLLLNVWKVTITVLVIWACVLGGISSVVYAFVLVHRKYYY
ncbi:MAG: hypothetical protein J6O50_00070 [Ruminiclostridium sp.]|nr:hypothetical protein [Ruminiclostridium sp.]